MFEDIQELLWNSNTWLALFEVAVELLNELGAILPVVLILGAGAEFLPSEFVRNRIATNGGRTYRSLRISSALLCIAPTQYAP